MRIPVLAFKTPSPGEVSLALFYTGSYLVHSSDSKNIETTIREYLITLIFKATVFNTKKKKYISIAK